MFSCLPTAVIRRTASVCRRRANVGLKDLFCGFRGRDGVPCAAAPAAEQILHGAAGLIRAGLFRRSG